MIRPGGLGLGDAKLAASAGAALGWISWQPLLSGTFAAFTLAAVVLHCQLGTCPEARSLVSRLMSAGPGRNRPLQ